MLKNILRFSIYHRYFVVSATLLVAILGAYLIQKLPIDAVPDITNNQVQINTEAKSLSPTEIEKQVTLSIETSLSGIPGLQYTRSLSKNGFSQVTAVFDDDVDIYFARQQISERLTDARENLPAAVEPKMGPISTGLGEVYVWVLDYAETSGKVAEKNEKGLQSDGSFITPDGEHLITDLEKGSYLRTLQDWLITPQIKSVKGLAGVDAIGGYVKQFTVEPNPNQLASYGLSLKDLSTALQSNNRSVGAGYIEHRDESYLVRADARLNKVDEIGNVSIPLESGGHILVHDIAKIGLGRESRRGSASINGHEAVIGTAIMRIGENSRTVSKAVDERLKLISKTLPAGIKITPVLDRSKLVDATIHTVQKNLIEGAILVIAVLFLLLGNIRAALLTASVIPISMLMMASGMVLGRISGNLMSLGAIDFGLIVDGAVIIVENCLRRLSTKRHELNRALTSPERLEEVVLATNEMIHPSVFGQAIIICSYLPIIALSGIEGKMFHPMAYTVIIALVAAFILSLTFIPAMVSIFITQDVNEKEARIIGQVKEVYLSVLKLAIRRRLTLFAIASLIFLVSLFGFFQLGEEFMPKLDEQDLALETRRMLSTGIGMSNKMQLNIEQKLKKIPEVSFVFSKVGTAELSSDPMPVSAADTYIIFKPKSAWPDPDRAKEDVVSDVRNTLDRQIGTSFDYSQPIEMRFNELIAGVRSDLAIKVFGDDFEQMKMTAKKIEKILKHTRGAADVKIEQTSGFPTMNIALNKLAIASYGFTSGDILDLIQMGIGGEKVGDLYEGDRRFDIIVRFPDSIRQSPLALGAIPLALPHPSLPEDAQRTHSTFLQEKKLKSIPLKELAQIQLTEGLNQVSRDNGKRRIVIQANVRDRDLGSFVEEVQKNISDKLQVPPGQWIEWGGQFENLLSAKRRLLVVVPLCFVAIFLILFAAFKSVSLALIVFTGVPLALSGGVLALWMRGIPFSVTAAVGFIALSGVAVLNGLVMISFINELRQEGRSLQDSIYEGSLARLRPILMTASVASLGFIPMALATGTGAEVQKPLATVVIGGLFSSTLLTLFVLPALYYLFGGKATKEISL